MTDTSEVADRLDAVAGPILRVEVRHLSLPTGVRSFVLPDGRRTPTDIPVLLTRVTDSDGAQGHSLLWFQHSRQAHLIEAGLRYLADVVVTQNPSPHAGYLRIMSGAARFVGDKGVMSFGASGLQMAIEDLSCRRLGSSLGGIVGRRRQHLRTYQTGLLLNSSIAELVTEARTAYNRGVRGLKMIVGKPTIAEDAERVQAVRECLPSDVTLMVDALQRWSVPSALEAADRFAEFGLAWIEDPLSDGTVDNYRYLMGHCAVAVATGETSFCPDTLQQLADAGVPYIVGELERLGGISSWLEVAERVRRSGASMLSHLYPHVSAQLLSTLSQTEVWLEYVPWFDQLTERSFLMLADGSVTVPDDPGSGFAPHPEATERLAISPWKLLTA